MRRQRGASELNSLIYKTENATIVTPNIWQCVDLEKIAKRDDVNGNWKLLFHPLRLKLIYTAKNWLLPLKEKKSVDVA